MARNPKYDWPDDKELQALLEKHGTAETARYIGCPPSSLSSRIRQRGLRGSEQPLPSDTANGSGKPDAASRNGKPDVANPNGKPDPNEKPDEAEPRKQSVREPKPSDEPAGERIDSGSDEPVGRKGSEPDSGDTADEQSRSQIWKLLSAWPRKEPVREPGPDVRPNRTASEPKRTERREEKPPNQTREPVEKPPNQTREPVEHLGSIDYVVREKPTEPAADADTPSAQGAARSERRRPHILRRVRGELRRMPAPLWRVLAVLALTGVAGLAAFISVRNDPKTYERETSFAVRPSSDVPPAAVNDVLGTLAQPDSAITETIVNMLGSPRLRDFAAQSAGVPATSVGGSGAEYVWSATRRTGSTIIDVRLTGPDDDKLLAMQSAAAPEAARLVEESYSPYRLETLSAPSPPVQVGPKIARTVGLALLLGALVGITLVLVERRLRTSLAAREGPARAPAERGEPWEH
jgi:capsular polysaccharide biosynthesis protein